MKDIFLSKLVLFGVLLCLAQTSTSQVTMGSLLPPNEGSLLDLKEYNSKSNNSTANKGFLLPRVLLTSPTNLYPMFWGNGTYTGAEKKRQDAVHSGLLVYNKTNSADFYYGLYSWDGLKWCALQKYEIEIFKINQYQIEIFTNQNAKLTLTVLPLVMLKEIGVIWESDNPAIATVSQTGAITPIAAGNTKVRVRSRDGKYEEVCDVKVKQWVPISHLESEVDRGADILHTGRFVDIKLVPMPLNHTEEIVRTQYRGEHGTWPFINAANLDKISSNTFRFMAISQHWSTTYAGIVEFYIEVKKYPGTSNNETKEYVSKVYFSICRKACGYH